ncbi:DUF4034 domain-containing protein [Dyella sp. LX-66]|uniref:DUF4034 domain-containing protein n=1 Tax=unclassified Dyella TaxID=2634549 RepID=UPI001BE128D8|nr:MULTISPECIES: DUF4034 domain-containing protein [unclassified Dyella]MBT2117106.1 DUF4034 domain-containing protein [Dyella sp. LX-1]MBT2139818.1 DUF4034 domain-containing protein [Dyella sp. LX-66]
MQRLCLKGWAVALAWAGMAMQPALARGYEEAAAKPAAPSAAAPDQGSFSATEIHEFLDRAHRAEAIADPLQRCIAYPDPPGSHWSPAATRAYCTYHMQTLMSYEEIKGLIESGKAAQLDAYLSDAAKKQLTQPGSAGLLDHIYISYFSDASAETHALVESWKRQRPKSAFALAASGRYALVMGWRARGSDYASETPQENFQGMDKWFKLARKDLEQAVALDPRVIPAYSAMINLAKAHVDREYERAAARKGLAVDAASYAIYGQLVAMAEPRWGGSLGEMQRIAGEAQAHAKDNGLLKLLLPLADAYEAKLIDCDCADPAAYRRILDQMPSGELLSGAANAVDSANKADLAVVYQSEVIRFYPWADTVKAKRMRHLITFGEKAWSKSDADALSANPDLDRRSLEAMNNVYMTVGDFEAVKKTFARLDELHARGE